MLLRSLEGKVALVTGASAGIGAATARAFAQAGARVVLAGRRGPEGEAVARQIQAAGGEARFIRTDVTQAREVAALVDATVAAYGRLDCAFNNAGSAAFGPLTSMSEEEWDAAHAVNLKGIWLCLKYQIPVMVEQGAGTIVNMAALNSLVGFPNTSVYAAAKGGVIALSRAAAMEYVRSGIRINVVSPGAITTDMLEAIPADARAQLGSIFPVGRAGTPEEVAEAVVYLCSPAAGFITGHNLVIDGGYSAQ
jgi:NAD(P)-dependent dehydrogenase (short-subunit alcohol dehydrogenase family)